MLSAYYFRAQMYTLVPAQVREDMAWLAAAGCDAVIVAVLEQDTYAAVENLDRIIAEAKRHGLAVWMTPSRWGGLVAGSPKVPSRFASVRPELWSLKDDGTPNISAGPHLSVFEPATYEFFCSMLDQVLERFDISGLIWDEPKNLRRIDHSTKAQAAAKEAGVSPTSKAFFQQAAVDFLDRCAGHAKALKPDFRCSLFTQGHVHGDSTLLDLLGEMEHVDEIGLDGRPWPLRRETAGQYPPENKKSLIDHGPTFLDAARRHGKRSFALIENHDVAATDHDDIDQNLPRVLDMGFDHLVFYYYPRSVEAPDEAMAILSKHLGRLHST